MSDQPIPPYEVFIPKDDSPVTDQQTDGAEVVDFDTDNPADYQDMGGHEDSPVPGGTDSDAEGAGGGGNEGGDSGSSEAGGGDSGG